MSANLPHPYFFGIDDDEFVERAAALHGDDVRAHQRLKGSFVEGVLANMEKGRTSICVAACPL